MSQTVLVADDSQTIRQIVGMALKASSYQILEASSARATMDALQRRPDIILLDYYMPDGSGYELCRAIKGNDATRHIHVVMLGGTYKNFDENMARQAGADAVIWKPFKTDQLISALNAAGARPAQAQAAPPLPAPAGLPSNPFASGSQRPLPPSNPFGSSPPPGLPRPSGLQQPQAPAAQPPLPAPAPQPRQNSQSRIPLPRPTSPMRQDPTPLPGQSQPGVSAAAPPSSGGGGASIDRAQIEEIVREEVRKAVRDELPNLLRTVMGDLVQQKIMPKMMQMSEERVNTVLNDQLNQRVLALVRQELESLLSEG